MKRIAILCGLVAAFLCIALNADAQYARKGNHIVDQNGVALSNQEIIDLVGNDVYEETVVGSWKQYKSGKGLITGGILGIGAGLAGSVLTGVKAGQKGYSDFETAVRNDSAIAAMYLASSAALSLGGAAISGGIVLKTIGKKRLNWVADQCNANLTYHIGATPNGMGIAINF